MSFEAENNIRQKEIIVVEPENKKVSDFLNDLLANFPKKHTTFIQIKEMFLNNNPDLIVDIKYGGLVFFDSKELIAGVFLYKNHISVEFGNGASLLDPHSVLEGNGKFRRHIKIVKDDDMQTKNIAHYIHEASI